MIYLNLGAGRNQRKDCINVDITLYPGIQQVVDLSTFPYPYADESIDGIYASHLIEHLPYILENGKIISGQEKFIEECLRILKKGGFLHLYVPHSSSVTSTGCMGHYRTYSYNTLKGYLSEDFYMFKKARFKTIYQRLNWWYFVTDTQGELPKVFFIMINIIKPIINFFINLSPRIAENTWIYLVGGCREIEWKGEKI